MTKDGSEPLSHFNAEGQAYMVDVSAKLSTRRQAKASGRVDMELSTLERIETGQMAKGDVLAVARLAAVMAAKKTADNIPLCHSLALTSVDVGFALTSDRDSKRGFVDITVVCVCTGPTGVEIEALHAVSIAALTIYDMCKAMDRAMTINNIRLLEKSGGRSGNYRAG